MSDRKDTTHIVIDKELIVYLRERSTIWQCRYCIDKQWQRTSTKEYDLAKAKKVAKEIFLEAQWRKKNDIAPITRYFKDIARGTIKKLKEEMRITQKKMQEYFNLPEFKKQMEALKNQNRKMDTPDDKTFAPDKPNFAPDKPDTSNKK